MVVFWNNGYTSVLCSSSSSLDGMTWLISTYFDFKQSLSLFPVQFELQLFIPNGILTQRCFLGSSVSDFLSKCTARSLISKKSFQITFSSTEFGRIRLEYENVTVVSRFELIFRPLRIVYTASNCLHILHYIMIMLTLVFFILIDDV